jgi:flagellar biosynthetic protein FlhB
MAESTASERSEQPTQERLRRAREEGQLPQSHEVGPALMVLALAIVLALAGPWLLGWFARQMQLGLSCGPAGQGGIEAMLRARAVDCLLPLTPFLLAAGGVAVLGSLMVGGGWSYAPKALRVDFGRLAPGRGLRELFSMRSGVQVVASLAKLTVLSVLVWWYLRRNMQRCMDLHGADAGGVLSAVSRLCLGVIVRIAGALAVIAALELLYQKISYKRRLRMTRQEVKEERRLHELSPEVRGHIRAVQIELVRKRMMQEVPKADVVLANPQHVAVALRYEAKTMEAPMVVAKGAELLAEKIKEIARAHNVPVLERPELARAVYRTVDVGGAIPPSLFIAVAEVLAMIYRLRKASNPVLA